MPGYVESHMKRGIERAYDVLLAQSFPVNVLWNPATPVPPPALLVHPDFTPRKRLIARELRTLFADVDGYKVAMVFGMAPAQAMVLKHTEEALGTVQFGYDEQGPYRLLLPKKKPFRKRGIPVVTRISFEELCFEVEEPKRVYQTAYVFLSLAVSAVLGEPW